MKAQEKLWELQHENAYLKGIIVGIQMITTQHRENANDYIPKLAFPESSAETAQLESYDYHDDPEDSTNIREAQAQAAAAASAPLVVEPVQETVKEPKEPKEPKEAVDDGKGYWYDNAAGALVYEPPKTAEQMYPWPEWKYDELPREKQERYNQLRNRKYGAGPIVREYEGKVEKLCPGCLDFKDIEVAWARNQQNPDGLNTYCRRCASKLDGIYRHRRKYRAGLPDPVPVLRATKHAPKRKAKVDTYVCAGCNIEKSTAQFEKVRFSDGHVSHAALCEECKGKADKKALQEAMRQNANLSPTKWVEYQGKWVQARSRAEGVSHEDKSANGYGHVQRLDVGW